MAYSRFFLTEQLSSHNKGDFVDLPMSSEDVHHAVVVLRATTAEKIVVVQPDGAAFLVVLERADTRKLAGRIKQEILIDPLPDVTLIQGVSKGERMDLCIRMSVEVGVARIIPVLTSRTIVLLPAHSKRFSKGERWRKIAHAAAKQSGRTNVPFVEDPIDFADLLSKLDVYDRVLVAWEEADGVSLKQKLAPETLKPDAKVAVVVGPEGGLAAEEVQRLTEAGADTFSLGDTILRTETAGVIATSLVSYELGGLGNKSDYHD